MSAAAHVGRNSVLVLRQLTGIGPALAGHLANGSTFALYDPSPSRGCTEP